MRASMLWNDVVPEKDGVKSSINDIAISPDGTRVVVAVGTRVLLYDGENGDLLESLRGHKDIVYSVDFSHDGSRFASGGRDNIVIIWKNTGQGLLKYTHATPIQRVKYSPVAIKLASCSEADFGMWTPEQTKVLKEKVTSRIISAAWTLDGSALALGMVSGLVSIRNHNAEEIARVERKSPVWCLLFVPGSSVLGTKSSSGNEGDSADILITGCWQKSLAFYKFSSHGYKLHSEKSIGFYPCAISMLGSSASKSSYLVVSGSNKKATMFSKEGVRLTDLCKSDSWIWGCACSPSGDRLVVGTDSGVIETLRMDFVSVHALYRDRYAYRENLTEIIVHHLIQDRKVRIKCKDLIRHIALYKNKLAVHLTDRVCIYESSTEDSTDMHFRVRRERMTLRPSTDFAGCDHMAITSYNVLFCTASVIESYSFDGIRQRVWMMEERVTFMKVDGGPDGREGLLVGLESGILHKIFVNSPFPMELTKRKKSIKCADLNLDRTYLATIDCDNVLTVVNIKTQDVLFTINGAVAVCFNAEVANVICYSTEKSIFVVAGLGASSTKDDGSTSLVPIEPQEQYISGYAVGFQGQRIYCLYRGTITSIDVPQGKYMLKALDANDAKAAYAIACLGVTESDWKLLAIRALRANAVSVAKNAFCRLKEMKFLNLIELIERSNQMDIRLAKTNSKSQGKPSSSQLLSLEGVWNAELLAYEGHHAEAAKAYARMNKIDEAIRVFTDMRMWEDAIMLSRNSGKSDVNDLCLKQAYWLQESGDWKGACDLFASLSNFIEAAKVIATASVDPSVSWQQSMIELVRMIPSDNVTALRFCGEHFSTLNEDVHAKETFLKLKEISRLMELYVRRQNWSEAAKLADEHEGKFDVSVFLPYADWLISNDQFEEAMSAYRKACRHDLVKKLLLELTKNAIAENRFKDASYYFWTLSKEAKEDKSDAVRHELLADLYFAYSNIHSYVTDPFTSHQPESLFQASRFILNSLGNNDMPPPGISKACILYTLTRQSMLIGTFKLARLAFDRLSKLKLPLNKQEEIELDMMIVQAKPVRDSLEYLPVCYRCGSTNPLLNPFNNKMALGDVCTNCAHPFVRSFINFDVLPLVEFVPHPSIGDEEAIELIRQSRSQDRKQGSAWKEVVEGNANVMKLDGDSTMDGPDIDDETSDLFLNCLNKTLAKQTTSYIPIVVDASTLTSMNRNEIYVCKPSSNDKRATFYRNMLPELSIAISQPCHRFFHLEDFEFSYLTNNGCPYSRVKNIGEYGSL